ncbi:MULTISPECIES: nucleotidyltransferase domain-containing protein [unclassified Pseudomonas]|uniref:nucleotidyltransferase domain-containing protein n=1 Tax=unclassified Pseudomonas TaxID=196821 RepID=UPI002449D316|nr:MULTISPECIES: nucleotidyltransferase domain-containing protein [unclassified Pseudomonas]MDG9925197.1 nucleotidyltransferase domain-containing protein [Pseudomonas sp. GD04045]MDH0035327.1 nucleotidyltransferase domain-containing protein [Pseudomonas sp. GD04019]
MSLASLLFTDYRRRVLGLLLLHPQRSYHLREIARLTATQPGTLTRELGKLAEAGVLTKQKVGNQLQYSANRQCPVFEELASILRKTSGLAEVLADALLTLQEQIAVAFVFGSMASGTPRSDSDIDLLLIGELGFAEVVAALYPLQATLGREINPKLYRPAEWRLALQEQGSFIRDVLGKPKLFILGSDADLKHLEEQG